MLFYSLNNHKIKESFKDAVIKGIASDRGLFFPERIESLPPKFWNDLANYSNVEIAFKLIRQFVDHIDENDLYQIIDETLNFEFPLINITENYYALELFHGPTMAFKDVGARFMARCLQHFELKREITVLVATSGDTGGAVANGFLGVKGVNVVILYPKNKVSHIQEKQLTALGQNIVALEVDGSFDDCQEMVKTAFLDQHITNEMQLTSANSINVARWLPQMFYFVFALKKLMKTGKKVVFSVPSGNFGNICAGLMAKKLGAPIDQFIAATNVNDVVPRFLKSKKYDTRASVPTISNAMDVGDPSNFVRILEIYNNEFSKLQDSLKSFSFTDIETENAIKYLYFSNNYIADPHGAIGYMGLDTYNLSEQQIGVFLETAHPAKFRNIVEPLLKITLDIPKRLADIAKKEKISIEISSYQDLKDYLLSR